jgi:hypothetical protein
MAFASERADVIGAVGHGVTVVDQLHALVNIHAGTVNGIAWWGALVTDITWTSAAGVTTILAWGFAVRARGAVLAVTVELGVTGALVGTVRVNAHGIWVTLVGSINALVGGRSAVDSLESNRALAHVLVGTEIVAGTVNWVTWIWVTVVEVGAGVAVTGHARNTTAVETSRSVDALTVGVAVVGVHVALVHVVVTASVGPAFFASARPGEAAVIDAHTIFTWGATAFVDIIAALSTNTITIVALEALALVGTIGVGADSVLVARVGHGSTLVNIIVT